MAHKPILIIGIGSSGLSVIEEVQNFHYENTGRNKPPYVEYLYIETNRDNRPSITALKNEIRRTYISLDDMKIMLREMKADKRISTNWLPPEDLVLSAGVGAGGQPACGRLALWGRNKEANNFREVIAGIKTAFNNISGSAARESDGTEPAVFVTGSLTGGTGTGVFIDIAYLIRSLIPGIKELYSLLMIPPKPDDVRESEIVYCNAYAGLRALQHYNKPQAQYQYNWPTGESKTFMEPPFELTQLISQSYNGSIPELDSLSGLFKMAGLYLFLNIIGLREKRFERLVDAKGSGQIGMYGTFGLSGIQYPKAQIQEYLALNLGSELLERWLNKKFYWSGSSQSVMDSSVIMREVKHQFGQALRTAFDNVDSSGLDRIELDIRKQVDLVNKNNISNSAHDHIFDLFTSRNREQYYQKISDNLQSGIDTLIQAIATHIQEDLDNFENLYYTKIQLEKYIEAIDNVLGYWKTLGVSSHEKNWEKKLNELVDWMLDNRYRLIGEQNKVLEDRMKSTLDYLRMHLFVKVLFSIKKNIKTGDTAMTTSTLNDVYELPRLEKIKKMTNSIQRTLGTRDDVKESTNFKSLARRKSEIESDMADKTLPILRVFKKESFQGDVQIARTHYNNSAKHPYPSKNTVIGENSLWGFLGTNDYDLHRILYHKCIHKFKQELDSNNIIKNFNLADYVKRKPDLVERFARKSQPFLLPIFDKTLKRSDNIPKMVIGADKGVITDIIQQLKQNNFHEFDNDKNQIKAIADLNNILVFYKEHANFEPLEDITYMKNEIAKLYKNYPDLEGLAPEKWFNLRNPYLNFEKDSWIHHNQL